ncbi:MAG: hypothetical protein WBD01_15665 [Salaquimonas sp.]
MGNKFLTICAGLIALCLTTLPAQAGKGGFVQYAYGPHVTHIADLPKEVQAPAGGSGLKLGFRHERAELFWMPLWGTTEGSYVFYQEAGDGWRSFPVPTEALPELGSMLNMELTSETPISIFSLIWGWLICGPLALFALVGIMANTASSRTQEAYGQVPARDVVAEAVLQRAQRSNQSMAAPNNAPSNGPPVFGKR